MYSISDFLLVPARNKMYEGAAPPHLILAGTSQKSERLYIIWLNIESAIHFITVAKSKMYWQGVKIIFFGKKRSVVKT